MPPPQAYVLSWSRRLGNWTDPDSGFRFQPGVDLTMALVVRLLCLCVCLWSSTVSARVTVRPRGSILKCGRQATHHRNENKTKKNIAVVAMRRQASPAIEGSPTVRSEAAAAASSMRNACTSSPQSGSSPPVISKPTVPKSSIEVKHMARKSANTRSEVA